MLGTSKSIWGFDPRSVPGCTLWLDASDTATMNTTPTVTVWKDKSGQSNDVTGTATATGGTMTFNGTNQAFSNVVNRFPMSNCSMFTVFSNTLVAGRAGSANVLHGSGGYPAMGAYVPPWNEQTATKVSGSWYDIASDASGSNLAIVGSNASAGQLWTGKFDGTTWTWASVIATTVGGASVASDASGSNLATGGFPSSVMTGKFNGSTWAWTTHGATGTTRSWSAIASDPTGSNIAAFQYNSNPWMGRFNGSTWSWTQQTGAPGLGGSYWSGAAFDSTGSNVVACIDNNAVVGIWSGRFNGSTWTWTSLGGANGGVAANWCAIASDSTGSNIAAAVRNGNLCTAKFNGSTWTWTTQPVAWGGAYLKSVVSDSTGSNITAIAASGVWKGTFNGSTWTWAQKLFQFNTTVDPRKLVSSSNSSNLAIFGSNTSAYFAIYTSNVNNGPSYASVTPVDFYSNAGALIPKVVANATTLVDVLCTSSNVSPFVNGQAASNLSNWTPVIMRDIYVGGPSNYFNGSISEILIYNNILSSNLCKTVEGYLMKKWNITPRSTNIFDPNRPFSRAFTMTDAPGCQLWLDAADPSTMNSTSTVTVWSDKSGNGNNVTGTATLSGSNMTFNGSTHAFSNLSYVFPNSNYSMFAVYSNTTGPTNSNYQNVLYGASGYPRIGTLGASNAMWSVIESSANSNGWRHVSSDSTGSNLFACDGVSFWTGRFNGSTWSWQMQAALSNGGPQSSAASSNGSNVAVAASYQVYTGIFNGSTWTFTQHVGSGTGIPAGVSTYYNVACDYSGSNVVVAANPGYVYTGIYNGSTWAWTQQGSPGSNSYPGLNSLASDSTGSNIAVARGTSGYIWTGRRISGGSYTWTGASAAGSNNWSSIGISANGSNIVAGINTLGLWRGTYNGSSWLWAAIAGSPSAGSWVSTRLSSNGSNLISLNQAWNVQLGSYNGTTWTFNPQTSLGRINGAITEVTSDVTGGILVASTSNWLSSSGSPSYIIRATNGLASSYSPYVFTTFASNAFTGANLPPTPATSNLLVSVVNSSTAFQSFVNGLENVSTTTGSTAATTGIYVGGPSNYFNGSISELLVYTTALTTTQRQQIEGLLMKKWGLAAQMASIHPYKSIPPTLITPYAAASPGTVVFTNLSTTGGTISWSWTSAFAEGYAWYVGTSPGSNVIANGFSSGVSPFTATFTGVYMTTAKQYYAWVTPYNIDGAGVTSYSGTGVSLLPPNTPSSQSGYLSSYTTAGAPRWTAYTGNYAEVATDPSGNVFQLSSILSNPLSAGSASTTPLAVVGGLAITKFTSDGTIAWTVPLRPTSNLSASTKKIATDAGGNIYAVGNLPTGGLYMSNVITDTYVIAAGFLTGGTTSALSTSPDGSSWTLGTIAGVTKRVNCVAWNGSLWVAGGSTTANTGALSTSPDGITWTSQTITGITGSVNCVAWNGAIWIACGYTSTTAGALSTSPDGITWTSQTITGITGSVNCVAWNGAIWIAGGTTATAGALSTSPDGITWTSRTITGITLSVKCVAWNGSQWVAGGSASASASALSTSPDGITWTSRTITGITLSVNCVAWNGAIWIAGGSASASAGALSTSPDGITWTSRIVTATLSGNVQSVSWNGTVWIAGGNTSANVGVIAISADGATWSVRPTGGITGGVTCIAGRGYAPNAVVSATPTSTGGVFIVKYSPAGSALWCVKMVATTGSPAVSGIATDSSNNVFMSCTGAGVPVTLYNANGAIGATLSDAGPYIVKYSSVGTVSWVLRFGTATVQVIAYGLAAGPSGNIIVSGRYDSEMTLYNVGGGTAATLPFAGTTPGTSYNCYIANYTSSGTLSWAAQVSAPLQQNGKAVTTDSSGNIFLAGWYTDLSNVTVYNSTALGGGAGLTIPGSALRIFFVVKYSSAGAPLWRARGILSALSGVDPVITLATDSNGSVYISTIYGSASSTTLSNADDTPSSYTLPMSTSFGSSSFTQQIIKYDSNGYVQWASAFRGENPSDTASPNAMVINGSNLYVTGGYSLRTATALQSVGYTYSNLSLGGTLLLEFTGTTNAFISKYSPNGATLWSARVAGSNNDGRGVATDSSGNVFMTGRYQTSAVTLYSSLDASNIALPSATTGIHSFLAKYSSAGAIIWAAQLAAAAGSSCPVYGVAVDASGNAFVAGYYLGTLTLCNATSVGGVGATLPSSGTVSGYIVKYSASGTVLWAAQSTSTNTIVNALAVDSSGNVLITGQYNSAMTVYNTGGGIGTTLPAPSGVPGAFVVKYSSNGTVLWATRASAVTNAYGQGITTDLSNNVYVTGLYSGILTIYDVGGAITTFPSAGGIVVKYSPTGTILWATPITSNAGTIGYAITTDSSGNVLVTGRYGSGGTLYNADGTLSGSSLPTPIGNGVFIVKYTPLGLVAWSGYMATSSSATNTGWGISSDSGGNVVVTGQFGASSLVAYSRSGTIGPTIPRISGTLDCFVAKYSATGDALWGASLGSISNTDIGYAAATDSSNNVYSVGAYSAAFSASNAV